MGQLPNENRHLKQLTVLLLTSCPLPHGSPLEIQRIFLFNICLNFGRGQPALQQSAPDLQFPRAISVPAIKSRCPWLALL